MATVTEAGRLVYTVAETAKLMSLSKGLTYQLCREGNPYTALGKKATRAEGGADAVPLRQ